ncbi:proteoglycan 4-like [Abrus precatorius]|uniref:Proteoglycan 4-like n=1 Tax=Abrus precatorius TaxID=3816 RepID=A0A8B8JH94_ABRPR|nr:proteoglycan 4-like [Abrus precatorius]
MAQRKQSLRFRIPWLSGPSESFSRRLKDKPKSPPHADTNIPIQRPSKPSVITPSELYPPSPTKTHETASKAEPQTQSPPHPTHPPSPSPHAQSPSHVHIASSSPKTQPLQSPPHNGAMQVPKPAAEETTPATSFSEQEREKMVLSEPKQEEPELKVRSPLRTTPKSPEPYSSQQVSFVPSSFPVSKTEPPFEPHPSSSLTSEHTNEVLKPQAEETTSPASPTPQEEKEKIAQETEVPKMKSPLKTTPKSPENLSAQPAAITGDEQRSTTPNSPLEIQSKFLQHEEKEKVVDENTKAKRKDRDKTTTPEAPLEAQSKFLQHEEKEKEVHETTKAERKGKETITTPKPTQHTIAFASGTTTKAKDSFAKVFRADKKPHAAQRETVERKVMFVTSNPSGKDTRVVSSTEEGTRNVSSITPETSVVEKAPLQKGIKDDITKFVHKLTASVHDPTQPLDDKQFSVITLAGDNRGAKMHVGSESAKKDGSIHIHRAYKTDPEESNEVNTDGEENNEEDLEEDDEVGMAYVNSNIQSINNSLMFHGSINERDPGVQVTLPQKPSESIKPNDKPVLKTQRTQLNINRAEKLTYQPTVKRSLRGLFPEPNASGPDDHPRSQGCKFSCDDIEDIHIL